MINKEDGNDDDDDDHDDNYKNNAQSNSWNSIQLNVSTLRDNEHLTPSYTGLKCCQLLQKLIVSIFMSYVSFVYM